MSAQVTEAHIALSARITRENGYDPESAWNRPHVLRDAQYIADSEAKATAELRAVFPKILQALGNGACCTPDVSVEFIKAIPNEVAEVVAHLRAEVDAQCLLNAKGSEREAVLLGRVDRMAKECLNLRADLDAIKAIRNEETARAERAEAEVVALKAQRGQSDYYAAALSAEAELATERARLDWLMAGGVCMVQHSGGFYVSRLHVQVSRAVIDAAMKEETK